MTATLALVTSTAATVPTRPMIMAATVATATMPMSTPVVVPLLLTQRELRVRQDDAALHCVAFHVTRTDAMYYVCVLRVRESRRPEMLTAV